MRPSRHNGLQRPSRYRSRSAITANFCFLLGGDAICAGYHSAADCIAAIKASASGLGWPEPKT
ncbi:hypothetical protein VITFI_CDS0791 [Vitreoscilla filiformis]|uniref:Uncharacterized protein n=1 Tax=Vitreoscilla filiformis TaxID=63 RepID=A0A221KC70_VITFI|nr:hypothetical protein VITFI_CDS0791 [Vitreoscilla filiformis]